MLKYINLYSRKNIIKKKKKICPLLKDDTWSCRKWLISNHCLEVLYIMASMSTIMTENDCRSNFYFKFSLFFFFPSTKNVIARHSHPWGRRGNILLHYNLKFWKLSRYFLIFEPNFLTCVIYTRMRFLFSLELLKNLW